MLVGIRRGEIPQGLSAAESQQAPTPRQVYQEASGGKALPSPLTSLGFSTLKGADSVKVRILQLHLEGEQRGRGGARESTSRLL